MYGYVLVVLCVRFTQQHQTQRDKWIWSFRAEMNRNCTKRQITLAVAMRPSFLTPSPLPLRCCRTLADERASGVHSSPAYDTRYPWAPALQFAASSLSSSNESRLSAYRLTLINQNLSRASPHYERTAHGTLERNNEKNMGKLLTVQANAQPFFTWERERYYANYPLTRYAHDRVVL